MKNIFFLFIFFNATIAYSGDSLELKKSIPIRSNYFTTDPIGNIYVVKLNNTLIKYNYSGDSLNQFNERRNGKMTQIDATNPLRILVYYSDYSQLILLDNMLSLKTAIKLNLPNLLNALCVSNSSDGGIWVYGQNANLEKINEKMEPQFSLSMMNVLDPIPSPSSITEQDRNLFVVDSTHGVYRFDQLGLLKNSYPFQTKEIQFFSPYLVYDKNPYLISYNIEKFIEKKIELPQPEDIIKVRMEKNYIYILRSQRLDIYYFE